MPFQVSLSFREGSPTNLEDHHNYKEPKQVIDFACALINVLQFNASLLS